MSTTAASAVRRITLETDPATLPLGSINPAEERFFHQRDRFILGTPELGAADGRGAVEKLGAMKKAKEVTVPSANWVR